MHGCDDGHSWKKGSFSSYKIKKTKEQDMSRAKNDLPTQTGQQDWEVDRAKRHSAGRSHFTGLHETTPL
jgi:hypothetical protein